MNCKNCKKQGCSLSGRNHEMSFECKAYVGKTNADRIRSMSDEELAELFEMIPHSGNPRTYTIDGFCIDDGLRTKRQWIDWLKKETKE